MIKAIIFDFFGVIGGSTYQLIAEKINVSRSANQKIFDLHKALDNGFLTQEEFLHQYAEIAGLSYHDFLKIYHDSNSRFAVSEVLLSYIAELKAAGYKIGLLSNVNQEAYGEFIEPLLARGLFEKVMASYKTGLVKPHQEAFEQMALELGTDPASCIMVDDLETNCQGARAAGLTAIQYKNIHQFKECIAQFLES